MLTANRKNNVIDETKGSSLKGEITYEIYRCNDIVSTLGFVVFDARK